MSKLKTPREKKLASLALDRRNVYGENDKASRKGIPKSKQRSHQSERRAANQPLKSIIGPLNEDLANDLEHQSRINATAQRREGFTKRPDAPLAEFIARQTYWRERRDSELEYWAARRPSGSPES